MCLKFFFCVANIDSGRVCIIGNCKRSQTSHHHNMCLLFFVRSMIWVLILNPTPQTLNPEPYPKPPPPAFCQTSLLVGPAECAKRLNNTILKQDRLRLLRKLSGASAAGLQFNRPRKGRRDTEIRRRLPELHRAQPHDSGAYYTAHNRNTKEEARAAKNAFFRIIADDATHHCIMRPRFVMYEIS